MTTIIPQSVKKILSATLIFLSLALIVNHFALPNMLSNDKLSNELYLIKSGNPELFANDYALNGTSWRFFYVPFVEILRLANRFTGSSEETYRILVPVVFFIFINGMFLFFYRLGISFPASLFAAAISSIYIPEVLHENWGIPGPSMIVQRHLALALLPFSYFLFYKYIDQPRLYLAFLVVGLAGNIHPVSSFYVTLIFLGAILFIKGFRKETLRKIIISGLTAILGIMPFLIWHFVLYPAKGDLLIINDATYLNAIWEAQPHVSPSGIAKLYINYFLTKWYNFWPLFGIFLLSIWLFAKKQDESKSKIIKTSVALFSVTAFITLFISMGQQILQIVFKIAPLTIEEPRAFRFVYFVLYLHLALLISYAYEAAKNYRLSISKMQKTVAIIAMIAIIVFMAYLINEKILRASFLLSIKKNDPESGQTCRLPMYAWIRENTPAQSIFLINPNRFPPFRICTIRGLINHYRDVPPAILSREKIIEWANRKHILEKAYDEKDPIAIIRAANQFGADYVITEDCLYLPGLRKIYEMNNYNCVYKTTKEVFR